ncbi:MAG: rhamnulokinase [Spirochaetales bacterium]|uniref:Rhamnulokinase n=1 Tax=Candidatus Thalassospirochaeta sargassi TaxID=3119039 RepID=A0AAJ1II28_9SPIO|nr:rhamnulokinase [Spirochaetales bacterium]
MKHIAIDLGASNGRVIVCDADESMRLEVVHRFPSLSIELPTGIHWNLPGIYSEILKGLCIAFKKHGSSIASIGIDSWGVDFSLVDSGGELMFLPYHYRDKRTDNIPEKVFSEIMPAENLFQTNGVQIMSLNTVFQLYAMKKNHSEIIEAADYYLSIPDLLTYWLTGVRVQERTHASTTGLFNPSTGEWAWELIDSLGLPRRLFGDITPSGSIIGRLREDVRRTTGAGSEVQFIAAASHDTQSAAYTVGNSGREAYLSCGTWSIIGLEQKKPTLSHAAFQNDFSNEASGFGGFNLLKNIMGLWILQECKSEWETCNSIDGTNREISYEELISEAESCSCPAVLIDVNDQLFLKTNEQGGPMSSRINTYLEDHNAATCKSRGEFVRLIVESLADYYGKTIAEMEEISGVKLQRLHFIGGGARNRLLAGLTEKKAGIEVVVGESEASALGNVMTQLAGLRN